MQTVTGSSKSYKNQLSIVRLLSPLNQCKGLDYNERKKLWDRLVKNHRNDCSGHFARSGVWRSH